MKITSFAAALAFAAASIASVAHAADTAPAGATGQCKDGTYTTAQTHRGACADHGGVKTWLAESSPAPKSAVNPESPNPLARKSMRPPETSGNVADASGKVWVNTKSHVYHCSGDRWYGKTKAGEYMSEQEAKAAGNRPDHGKACTA